MVSGIIVPTQEDMDFLSEFLTPNDIEESISDGFVTKTGFIDHQRQDRVTIISSGMGKVNTAMATQRLIDFGCVQMILFGTAGAVDRELSNGNVLVPETVLSHDSDTELSSQVWPFEEIFHPDEGLMKLMRECAETINPVVSYLPISSGDTYVSDTSELFTTASAVDMESYAFAHVCARNNKPFIIVKAISNHADKLCYEDSNENEYGRFAALLTSIFVFNLRDTAINLSSLHVPTHMLTTRTGNVDLHPDWKIFTNY